MYHTWGGKEEGFAVNHHLYVSYLGWERGWLCCEPSSLCIILGVGKRKALLRTIIFMYHTWGGKEEGFAVNHHLYVSYLGWERGRLCCEPSSLCIILGVGKRKALLRTIIFMYHTCGGKEDGFAVNHHLYVSYLGWERGWLCCEPSSLCIILGGKEDGFAVNHLYVSYLGWERGRLCCEPSLCMGCRRVKLTKPWNEATR